MKRFAFLLGSLLTLASQTMLAQMDASIKLNEVMTQNESSLIDEYGARNAWVEIANLSHLYRRSRDKRQAGRLDRLYLLQRFPV